MAPRPFLASCIALVAWAGAIAPAWSADTLDLPTCIRRAIARNPGYRAAQLGVDAAARSLDGAQAAYRPGLSFDSGVLATAANPLGVPALVANNALTEYKALLDVDQPLDLGGGLGAARAKAEANLAAAQADARTAGGTLVLSVVTAFYHVREASESVDVAHLARDQQAAQVNATRARFRNGEVPRLDVNRAELALASAEADVTKAVAAWATSRAALGALLGSDDEVEAAAGAEGSPGRRPALPAMGPLAAWLSAAGTRPEVAGAEARRRGAAADVATAEAALRPTAHLVGGVGWDVPALAGPSAQMGWDAGVNLNWPVFDLRKLGTQRDANRLLADQAAENVVAQRLSVAADVRQAWADAGSARAQAELAARNVTLAEATARIAEVGYRERTTSDLELVTAQQQLRQARLAEASAYYEALIADAKLRWAAGASGPRTPPR